MSPGTFRVTFLDLWPPTVPYNLAKLYLVFETHEPSAPMQTHDDCVSDDRLVSSMASKSALSVAGSDRDDAPSEAVPGV